MNKILMPALVAALAAAPLAAHAQQQAGSLSVGPAASQMSFQDVEVRGAERSLSGNYLTLTSGDTVVITERTRIHKSSLRPGAVLDIRGSSAGDGLVIADSVSGR